MKCILSLFILLFSSTSLFAQNVHTYTGLKNFPPFLRNRILQRKAFTKLSDSLFMAGDYTRLIKVCRDSMDNNNVKDLVQYSLIGAYYKTGRADSSEAIIHHIEIASGDRYFDIGQLFAPHNISAMSYMDNATNRTAIEDYIISHYRKESYSKISDGITLIKFLNNDQWIRRGNFLSKSKLAFINWPNHKFRKADNKQGKALYEFLKKNNGLFTESEVGGYMFGMQFLLMAHDDNKKHRKLYLSYVKKAADEGICLRTRVLDFLLRTDVLNMGWPKFKKIEKERIEQLKKEYNITEDYHFGAF